MNGNPNKKQQDFHAWCRELGCAVCGDSNPSIHHIKGSKMKLKGCVKPGEWYVIPLCYEHHQGEGGVHKNKTMFIECHSSEKEAWWVLMADYYTQHGHNPMSEEEYQIILERG